MSLAAMQSLDANLLVTSNLQQQQQQQLAAHRPANSGPDSAQGREDRFVRIGVWQLLLFLGWLEQKLLCSLGFPDDCASDCTRQEATSGDSSCHGSAGEHSRLPLPCSPGHQCNAFV